MNICRAKLEDIDQIINLLSQVLEIHVKLRPDVFRSNTTKYSKEELKEMVKDDNNPIYVATDGDKVLGYAMCEIKSPKFSSTMIDNKIFYVDDFCVDENYRNKKIGTSLFNFLVEEAKRLDCYEITLSHWEGNIEAKAFYDKMGMKTKYTMLEFIIKK